MMANSLMMTHSLRVGNSTVEEAINSLLTDGVPTLVILHTDPVKRSDISIPLEEVETGGVKLYLPTVPVALEQVLGAGTQVYTGLTAEGGGVETGKPEKEGTKKNTVEPELVDLTEEPEIVDLTEDEESTDGVEIAENALMEDEESTNDVEMAENALMEDEESTDDVEIAEKTLMADEESTDDVEIAEKTLMEDEESTDDVDIAEKTLMADEESTDDVEIAENALMEDEESTDDVEIAGKTLTEIVDLTEDEESIDGVEIAENALMEDESTDDVEMAENALTEIVDLTEDEESIDGVEIAEKTLTEETAKDSENNNLESVETIHKSKDVKVVGSKNVANVRKCYKPSDNKELERIRSEYLKTVVDRVKYDEDDPEKSEALKKRVMAKFAKQMKQEEKKVALDVQRDKRFDIVLENFLRRKRAEKAGQRAE